MENNNNLTQENRAFKKGDAYETLGIINTWIGNMDTKVSFALALAGVLIGVIFEKGMPSAFERITEVSKLAELSGGEIIAAILVALLYLSSFISMILVLPLSLAVSVSERLSTNKARGLYLSNQNILLPQQASNISFPFSIKLFLLISSISTFSILCKVLQYFFSLV